jgi:DNA topoisomerase-1
MKNLVIVESPTKAKTLSGFLGKGYTVKASLGHVRDLPQSSLGVDVTNNFEPEYVVSDKAKKNVSEVIKEAQDADVIYLATDPDREGEAISWHISNRLPSGKKFKRAKTNSITKTAITEAIQKAGDIDYNLVDSYETRRILDRIVGYKCSFVTMTATGGKSAGRVQSAALRVLAEREKEIKSFIPVEYWDISADMISSKKETISTHLITPDKMDIKNADQANAIVKDLTDKTATVTKYESKEVYISPRAPFTTSTLQQTAATILGWDQEKTMKVAQRLYENGRITYMRTDSVSVIPSFIDSVRNYISHNYDKEYLPNSYQLYSNKNANAQEAHEAIRPIDVSVKEDEIHGEMDDKKLYDMIWRRTVSSQMEKSKNLSVSARFAVDKYEFAASGSIGIFDGWKKVWKWSIGEDKILPSMKVGDKCEIKNIVSEQKFTQPPSRYTKSSITKMYEETGIGRPSTYASITKTLKARGYIESLGNSYQVTDLGIKVSDFLIKADFCFIDLKFTSEMEEKLDKICSNSIKKLSVLTDFWERLKKDIDKANAIKQEQSITAHKCTKCQNNLLIKHGKFGTFLACSNKECKYTANMDENGLPKEKVVVEKIYCAEDCPKCSSKMVLRKSKFGEFYGCAKYPECRSMRDKEGKVIEPKNTGKTFKKKFWKNKKKKDE